MKTREELLRASGGFPKRSDAAFTLLDTMLAVTVTLISMGLFVGVGTMLVRAADLDTSVLSLVTNFRNAQSLAATSGTAGMIWLDPYDTRYHLSHGTVTIAQYQFAPDVNYVDGYLHLVNRRVSYDTLGNSQEAGQIVLQSGPLVKIVNLYMGTGLQSLGG